MGIFSRDRDSRSRNLVLVLVLFALGLILILGFIFVYSAEDWWGNGVMRDNGAIGDYFNGMLGPFIAFTGVITTFAAFYVQYQANQDQREAIERQQEELEKQQQFLASQLANSIEANQLQVEANLQQKLALEKQQEQLDHQQTQQRIDRFEQRLFEMLRIHRENVDRFTIVVSPTKTGRQSFSGPMAFWIAALEVETVLLFLKTFKDESAWSSLTANDRLGFSSYQMVYFGYQTAGDILKRWNQFGLSETEVTEELLDDLQSLKVIATEGFSIDYDYQEAVPRPGFQFPKGLADGIVKIALLALQNQFPIENYTFCNGHSIALGHYFRHLFQLYAFVDDAAASIGDAFDAYQYAKLIRAQLSDYELKLLCYNLHSPMGEAWWSKGYVARYKPLKNVPLDQIPHELLPLRKLKDSLAKLNLPHEIENLQDHFDFPVNPEMVEATYVGLGHSFPSFSGEG